MKRIILFGLALLLLMSSALALTMPHPIFGTIRSDGFPVKNAEIDISNLDSGIKTTAYTDEKGRYQVDLGNVDPTYRDGNTIEVSLVFCGDVSICNKKVTVSGGANEVSWDIAKENIDIIPPETIEILKVQCWDGSSAESVSQCSQRIVCDDGSEVHSQDECPELIEETPKDKTLLIYQIISGLLVIALAVLAKFKWGKGFVGLANYYVRKGDVATEREDYAQAKKYYERAAKMVSTAVKKARDGSYK